MKKRILIFAIYPAPYRVNLFEQFYEKYDCDVFFLKSTGDERNKKWFANGSYHTLDSAEGRESYKNIDLKSYDMVVLYDYSMAEAVKLALKCRIKKIPYVINCDGVMLAEHGNFVNNIIKRYLVRGTKGCLASGENAKKYFMDSGAKEERIFLHPFSALTDEDILAEPVSQEEKKDLRKKLGLPADAKIAIAVGRFIPLKRYNEFLTKWKTMPDDCYLLLIGGGGEESIYRNTVKTLGLTNVIIKPFHPKNELFDYYKASDVFVHPTSYDVWGLVINEAMACGLPIIVSDHCIAGLELIKDGENGYVIPMGEDEKMCKKALEVLTDEKGCKLMAQNALHTIKPYTMENMAKKQIEAFGWI